MKHLGCFNTGPTHHRPGIRSRGFLDGDCTFLFFQAARTDIFAAAYEILVTDSARLQRYFSKSAVIGSGCGRFLTAATEETTSKETKNEHLDDIVRRIADRMDRWFHRVSRGRRSYPPAVGLRGHFPHPSLCYGEKRRLKFLACQRAMRLKGAG